MVSYTKLKDGSWGVRGMNLSPHTQVEVTKKDGSTRTETVGRVIWTGADGTTLATIISTHAGSAGNGYHAKKGRRCKTDGNCSSFGNGRSCGGYDCDGF